tara:strand:- start:97 stop:474 length:378 start_codon:yes stop_codon:yes gene_type:complete
MKRRCKLKDHYINKGIKVCDEWINNYDQFLKDMGRKPTPNHSIDRINNLEGYNPTNCRWATKSEQQQNKGNNNVVCINGEEMCLSEYSRRIGVNCNTLRERKKRGIPDELLHIRHRKPKKNKETN